MQVPFTRPLGCALVVIVGIAVSSTGCRSTRDSLSGLPGMGWLGPREEDFSGLASEEGKPGLPPPSEAATPEVVTNGASSKRSPAASPPTKYPDTGYPTTLPGGASSSTDSLRNATGRSAASVMADDSPSSTSNVSRSRETQHGFYGEQYPASSAGNPSEYDRSSTGDVSAPAYGDYSDAGSPGRSYAGGDDRWNSDGAATTSPAASAGSSDYGRHESGGSDPYGTQGVSDVADPLTQSAQDVARGSQQQLHQGVDAVRQGVNNEYQQFTRGVSSQVENVRQSAIGRVNELQSDVDQTVQQGVQQALQGAGAAATAESTDGGATNGTAAPGQGPAATTSPEASGYVGGASLNPPAGALPASTLPPATSSPPAAAPARSTEPWRPGSTQDYPQTPSSTSSGAWPPSGPSSSVAPASYDGWGSDSAPASGWSQSQRLAPTYR